MVNESVELILGASTGPKNLQAPAVKASHTIKFDTVELFARFSIENDPNDAHRINRIRSIETIFATNNRQGNTVRCNKRKKQ